MDLSFQLYSARNVPSLDDFLGKLAALGYKQVEGYGGLYADADGFAAKLKQHGLAMPTGHFGLDMLKDKPATLKVAETVGVKTIYCPHISPDLMGNSDAKWTEFAETLAGLGETYRAEGYGFGWHNHHFEFWKTESGKTPMEIILSTAPDIEWEMDVAWVKRGKEDPVAWMGRFGERISAVHVKDIAPEGENADEDGWADVGHGTMNWNSLINEVTTKTKAKYFVAEHDKPADAERFARRSIETAKAWK
jgi:sugar phosphate isomerase/epimerase